MLLWKQHFAFPLVLECAKGVNFRIEAWLSHVEYLAIVQITQLVCNVQSRVPQAECVCAEHFWFVCPSKCSTLIDSEGS